MAITSNEGKSLSVRAVPDSNYDVVAYTGRFQFATKAHAETVKQALRIGKKILIFMGSSNRTRSPRFMLNFKERVFLFKSYFSAEELQKIEFIPLLDYIDDIDWFSAIRSEIFNRVDAKAKVAVIGYEKDHTSYYLKRFAPFDYVRMFNVADINATDIRKLMLETTVETEADLSVLKSLIESMSNEYVASFAATVRGMSWFANVKQDYLCNIAYAEKIKYTHPDAKNWESAVVCVDSVIFWQNEVLLVKRGQSPGIGNWAIVGGHIGKKETTLDAALRESKEESGLKTISKGALRRSLLGSFFVDSPERSERARVFTNVFVFELTNTERPELEQIQAMLADGEVNDVVESALFPIEHVLGSMKESLFEDHHSILMKAAKVRANKV